MAVSTRRMEERFPVRNIQIALQALSEAFPTIAAPVPDGIYGPVTTAAVAEFQRLQGLSASGVTDRPTWDALHGAYFQWLRARSGPTLPDAAEAAAERALLLDVQQILQRIGLQFADFGPVELTGTADAATTRELRRFQARALLPETGTLDHATWERLVLLRRLLDD